MPAPAPRPPQVLALEPRNRQATEELRGLEALEGADDEGAAMMATF